MNIVELVHLYRESGIYVKENSRIYFRSYRFRNYNFPLERAYHYDRKTIKRIGKCGLVSVLLVESSRKNATEFVLQTDSYQLASFERKVRNRIRKSIASLSFKKPLMTDLFQEGLSINRQTFERIGYRNSHLTNEKKWEKHISTLYGHKDVYILGAYDHRTMVAYILAIKLEEKYIIQYAYFDKNRASKLAPLNGLIFNFVSQILKLEQFVNLSYGLESFNEAQSLQRFKSNMRFTKHKVTRAYLINPLLIPIIKVTLCIYMSIRTRTRVKSNIIRNIIRLYQGHRIAFRDLKSI